LSHSTIVNYLKQGSQIGWCNYDPKMLLKNSAKRLGINNGRIVVRLEIDGTYIDGFYSIAEASRVLKLDERLISSICSGGRKKSTGDFVLLYKKDYLLKITQAVN